MNIRNYMINMTIKEWVLIGIFAFGLPLAIAFIVAFWETMKLPRIYFIILICLYCMAGGFLWGSVMYIYYWIVMKIRSKPKYIGYMTRKKYSIIYGILFYGILGATIFLFIQKYVFHSLIDIFNVITTYIIHSIGGFCLAFMLYEVYTKK